MTPDDSQDTTCSTLESMTDEPGVKEWFYCRKHETVEDETGCAYRYRMGPYATREEASRAYEIARKRNEAWDDDPAWNDEEDREE